MRAILGVSLLALLSTALSGAASGATAPETLDLFGSWAFQLDPEDRGIEEAWQKTALPDWVLLPGSLNQNGIGDPVTVDTPWMGTLSSRMWHRDDRFAPYRDPANTKILFWLQPDKYYAGAAWYQREVDIPDAWRGKHLSLFLERCHWETRLWVDGIPVGTQNSLSTPHEYNLTALLAPGKHTLTLRIDNRYLIDVGVNAHSVSDNTQTNWNGVAGAMELRARDLAHVADVQVYPNVAERSVRVVVETANHTGNPLNGTLSLTVRGPDAPKTTTRPEMMRFVPDYPPTARPDIQITTVEKNVRVSDKTMLFEEVIPLGENARLWGEFDPALYTLETVLTVEAGTARLSDSHNVNFGLREIGVDGTQFTLNGQRIFLRGTLECAIFPRTGYPPTDETAWVKIIRAARSHGLNHLRFHSWCPPEAAFSAADHEGFLLQIEGPFWTNPGKGDPLDAYIYEECDRILRAYGNHPSFAFLAYGNEPGGAKHEAFLAGLVEYWKGKDPRRLYTAASGWPMIDDNQYHVTYKPRVHAATVRFKTEPYSSMSDYRDFVAQWPVPVVSHEIGQWCVFPNLEEIPKYTGPLKPRNFEIVRDLLAQQGLLAQANDFLMASGKLQTLCYKEEIEAALRTPGFGGFQLLDLHDFPGQGTALVGVLDPFWEPKGYVSPEEFRRFCGPTVPLLRMPSCVYTSDQTFRGAAEVTHFGPVPLPGVTPQWRLLDREGAVLREGSLAQQDIPRGGAVPLGEIVIGLSELPAPAQLKIELSVGKFKNDWDLWVYPAAVDNTIPEGVHVATRLDESVHALLQEGKRVLLLPEKGTVAPARFGPVPAGFPPIFWNTFWFPSQELRTLGLLMDEHHPLFAQFPTEFHSNWQWWDLATHAQVLSLDGLPSSVRPLVQIIDDWNTCRRLGLVFEVMVDGPGRLLVCGIDLQSNLDERPAARQFLHSLLAYMASDRFTPAARLTREELSTVFTEPALLSRLDVRASANSAQSGYEAQKAVDGDPGTFWHTQWDGDKPAPYPHWIRFDFDAPVTLKGLALLPRQDMNNGRIGRYEVFVGDDPDKLGRRAARGELKPGPEEQTILFDGPRTGKTVLLRALGPAHAGQPWATIAELRLLTAE